MPVSRSWKQVGPGYGLGETLSSDKSRLSKVLLKVHPKETNFVNPKWQPKSIFLKSGKTNCGLKLNSGIVLTHSRTTAARMLVFFFCNVKSRGRQWYYQKMPSAMQNQSRTIN